MSSLGLSNATDPISGARRCPAPSRRLSFLHSLACCCCCCCRRQLRRDRDRAAHEHELLVRGLRQLPVHREGPLMGAAASPQRRSGAQDRVRTYQQGRRIACLPLIVQVRELATMHTCEGFFSYQGTVRRHPGLRRSVGRGTVREQLAHTPSSAAARHGHLLLLQPLHRQRALHPRVQLLQLPRAIPTTRARVRRVSMRAMGGGGGGGLPADFNDPSKGARVR